MTSNLAIKNGRYYAVINYKEDGQYKKKWISLGLAAKNNKRKAESMLENAKREFEEQLNGGEKETKCSDGGNILFVAYLLKWLSEKKPLVQLSTWEGYETYVKRHIIPYFEPLNLQLNEVKPMQIKSYYESKYTGGRCDDKEGGLSISSIKKHALILRESLSDAVMCELIDRNPATGVKLPAKDVSTKEKVFLDADQANIMLKAFDGHQLQALVYITIYYGLRRSEALGLRWSAIDFEKGTLTINHTVVKNKTTVYKDSTKTQSSYHTFLLIDDVRAVLLKQREIQAANKKKHPYIYQESDYVFVWEDGSLYKPDYVTRAFKKVLKEHGLPDMRFHDLRHSTASILYDKGWDLKDVQDWLRHSSVEVSGDIYTHISESRKAKMAAQLNSTFTIGKDNT